MNTIEYKAMKKLATVQFGADDADSLNFFAEKLENQAKIIKWASIIVGILALPLCLIIIGIPMLLTSVAVYFIYYKKQMKKAQMFKEHLNNDPEFSIA
jgi:hypothetical protein